MVMMTMDMGMGIKWKKERKRGRSICFSIARLTTFAPLNPQRTTKSTINTLTFTIDIDIDIFTTDRTKTGRVKSQLCSPPPSASASNFPPPTKPNARANASPKTPKQVAEDSTPAPDSPPSVTVSQKTKREKSRNKRRKWRDDGRR